MAFKPSTTVMHPFVTFAAVALCVSVPQGAAEAKATYTTFAVASVWSINSGNTVTGVYRNGADNESFMRTSDGAITQFAVPSAYYTEAKSINDADAITGHYGENDTAAHGFLRAADGTIATFDVPGATYTFPYGINNKGTITGYHTDSAGNHHGFVRAVHGTITTFDVANALSTDPRSISPNGEIVGSYTDSIGHGHGFIRTADGTITTIDVSGATGTLATAINVKGIVTGWYGDSNGDENGFVRTPDGTITTFSEAGCDLDPAAINRQGVITGVCYNPENRKRDFGFFRRPDGKIRIFRVPGTGRGGTYPTDINDSGVIAGTTYSLGGFLRIP